MTKKELTELAKSHNARIICNGRGWGFYYISQDEITSFLKKITDQKASASFHFDAKDNEFSITVTLK